MKSISLPQLETLTNSPAAATPPSRSSLSSWQTFLATQSALASALRGEVGVKAGRSLAQSLKTTATNDRGPHRHPFIESLRKRLQTKAGSLRQLALKHEDLQPLGELLVQCGYTTADATKFINALKALTPDGKVSLDRIFRKIGQLAAVPEKAGRNATVNPAAMPHIEATLRDHGLTPADVESVFRAARAKDGGLDLNKLIHELKALADRDPAREAGAVRDLEALIDKVRAFGQPVTDEPAAAAVATGAPAGAKVSPTGLADGRQPVDTAVNRRETAAKLFDPGTRTAGVVKNDAGVPQAVKIVVEQITEKVVPTAEANSPLYVQVSSSVGAASIHHRNRLAGKDMPPAGDRTNASEVLHPSRKGTAGRSQSISASFQSSVDTEKGVPLKPSYSGGADAKNDLEVTGALNRRSGIMPEHAFQATAETVSAGGTSELKPSDHPLRQFQPAYLLNQVGRQIAGSIFRHERIVKLRLNPPDLGFMKLEIDMTDDALNLSIVTEKGAVKELLLANVAELRRQLIEQGITLERIDIQTETDSGQSPAGSREWQRHQPRGELAANDEFLRADSESPDRHPQTRPRRNALNRLDLVA